MTNHVPDWAAARALIKAHTGVEVDRLIQVGVEPAVFFLRLADGTEIKLGGSSSLLRQHAFRRRMLEAAFQVAATSWASHAETLIPRYCARRRVWEDLVQALLDLRELRDAPPPAALRRRLAGPAR